MQIDPPDPCPTDRQTQTLALRLLATSPTQPNPTRHPTRHHGRRIRVPVHWLLPRVVSIPPHRHAPPAVTAVTTAVRRDPDVPDLLRPGGAAVRGRRRAGPADLAMRVQGLVALRARGLSAAVARQRCEPYKLLPVSDVQLPVPVPAAEASRYRRVHRYVPLPYPVALLGA